VYESYTTVEGKVWHSISNVGNNPTIENDRFGIETHLLDFEGDLYGKDAKVEFVRQIRQEMKFPNIDALQQQIANDIESIR